MQSPSYLTLASRALSLEVENNGKLDQNFATLGQLYIKAKLGDKGEIKLGRQLHDSLLLKSTNNRSTRHFFGCEWSVSIE
jgi:hypothetical protein